MSNNIITKRLITIGKKTRNKIIKNKIIIKKKNMWGSLFIKLNNVIILIAQKHITNLIKISRPLSEIDKMNRLIKTGVLSCSVKN